MSHRKESEELLKIINMLDTVEKKGADPFLVEVSETLDILKKFLDKWKGTEELTLDIETINKISTIVKLQGDWLKFRSSSLYADPFLIELKLKILGSRDLAECLIRSWRPIIALERIYPERLKEAMDYYNNLATLSERRREEQVLIAEPGSLTVDDLVKMNLMTDKEFDKELQSLWQELKEAVGSSKRVLYWDFVYKDSYYQTLRRAYLTSFLVTYGYADIQVKPLEDAIYLTPLQDQQKSYDRGASSVPITIDYEDWLRKGGEKKGE